MVTVMLNGKVERFEARLDSLICCRSPPGTALARLSPLFSSVSPKFPPFNVSNQAIYPFGLALR